tara:strand:+ start:588 stop:872 length:285 start_codon:yes stop_codon:yes gene_type:complete
MTKINDNGTLRDMTTAEQTEYDALQVEYQNNLLPNALKRLRRKRDRLLSETDYFGASDNTMSEDMKTYRQELRDLTNGLDTVEKVENVTWPTKP